MTIYIDGIIYSLQKGGGITRYTNELIEGLLDLGYKVVVILHPNTQSEPHTNNNTEIVRLKPLFKINGKMGVYINYFSSKSQIVKYFKDKNIKDSLLHSTYLTYYKNLKIPQVITVYDLTREKFPNSFNYFTNKIVSYTTKNSVARVS